MVAHPLTTSGISGQKWLPSVHCCVEFCSKTYTSQLLSYVALCNILRGILLREIGEKKGFNNWINRREMQFKVLSSSRRQLETTFDFLVWLFGLIYFYDSVIKIFSEVHSFRMAQATHVSWFPYKATGTRWDIYFHSWSNGITDNWSESLVAVNYSKLIITG